ncbi:spermidine synthase [Verticiella sediminum]|uniref:spermidine synthase n=1 Tax=Verticiella sediminum TaxID=1247510 RepID=UPI001FE8E42D|nr:fused MFS/spermidine synthase [Verticiella sediminum]
MIHVEPSAFSPIVVYEENGERCMTFGSVRAAGRQTCVDIDAPSRMVFAYTRMMMSALFIEPAPARVLIVGLGGGTLPRALAETLPDAAIDTVEIDPAVLNVARAQFGYATDERQRVFIEDGRKYVQDAARRGERYDLVVLDAFDVNYIPPHLLTREFLEEVRGLLTPGGVLAANTFTASRLYQQESATYAAVFGGFFNLRSNNRVILAVNGELPDDATLRANAERLAPRLARYGVDIEAQLRMFSRAQDWPTGARVLTDSAPIAQP